MKKYKQLTSEQRYQIYGLKQALRSRGIFEIKFGMGAALRGWCSPAVAAHAR